MIALEDTRWANLSHAYGSASDIPQLARDPAPKDGYDSEPWFTLWSSICHQRDGYDASYAALPHIVDITCKAKEPLDFSFFQLPAAIEIARANRRGPDLPADLTNAYSEAVLRLAKCIALHLKDDRDESMLLSAMSALAASKVHHRVAEAIMDLDDNLIGQLIELDFGG